MGERARLFLLRLLTGRLLIDRLVPLCSPAGAVKAGWVEVISALTAALMESPLCSGRSRRSCGPEAAAAGVDGGNMS